MLRKSLIKKENRKKRSKLSVYTQFWSNKPSYHIDGSAYSGLRMDIDKYYSIEENQKELEEINNSFGKIFEKEKAKKEKSSTIT